MCSFELKTFSYQLINKRRKQWHSLSLWIYDELGRTSTTILIINLLSTLYHHYVLSLLKQVSPGASKLFSRPSRYLTRCHHWLGSGHCHLGFEGSQSPCYDSFLVPPPNPRACSQAVVTKKLSTFFGRYQQLVSKIIVIERHEHFLSLSLCAIAVSIKIISRGSRIHCVTPSRSFTRFFYCATGGEFPWGKWIDWNSNSVLPGTHDRA